MADEPTTEQKTTEQIAEQPADVVNWRNLQPVQDLFAEVKALRDKSAAEETAKAEREQGEALKRGEHEQVIAKLKAEQEAMVQAHERSRLETSIRMALLEHGVSDPLVMAGAIALHDGEDLAEYAAKIAEERATPLANNGLTPPGPTPVASAGKTNWAAVRQQLQSRDSRERAAARQQLEVYIRANGVAPPER